jgi:hypothetical protein
LLIAPEDNVWRPECPVGLSVASHLRRKSLINSLCNSRQRTLSWIPNVNITLNRPTTFNYLPRGEEIKWPSPVVALARQNEREGN